MQFCPLPRCAALRLAARLARCRAGGGAVEFAMLAPVLLVLLFGILQGGLLLGIAHSVEQLSADAGRYAATGLDADERQMLAARWLARQAPTYPLIRPGLIAARTTEADGALTVTVDYDASYLPRIPILDAVFRLPTAIERSATLMVP
ncbi:TadE/TadG family type IV pilus assembly protein [Aureimonas leprariae]|uniref:Pilus assembly protein n=1 Tax=Plantimonas leprariae TaxID=2615207 RepID=A0A7V7PRB6_9HYPH|nr:TadE/TadG family type IV pilus assembly protein [Aureimonas leprariae]KAB0681269.1 pilus assembly protein [Aureimonas leprariae]